MNEIYLASRSPRRLELLQQMGVACKTVLLREETNRSRDVDESPLASENPFIYVERMAKMKAEIGSLRAAVAVTDGTQLLHDTCVSRVRFRDLTEGEINGYINTNEPMGKAGAYAIQGLGAMFIERLEGSYSGVMGLPIFETSMLLSRFGVCVL